ncbi:hypothetical protein [Streptomyces sp. H27-C3]|uniref:hypothetical protein n=1 Tax=Streptomyces sp. H27-C3 TaxID=3046305 RepID=UPI0024BAF02E|nr:hypothetical protein [Streptomyces sp. H27-C3]MDJ0461540.1 hypothetical protein [Streptomyces sp. H27-C3]
MSEICAVCGIDAAETVAVGLEHANSGPGRILYACLGCRQSRRILPLDQHPADSYGFPRFDYAMTPQPHPH